MAIPAQTLYLIGFFAVFIFSVRQYAMIDSHSTRSSYIARLLEKTPGVEDFNAIDEFYRESSESAGFIHCVAEQLRCIEMKEFDTRRMEVHHDALTCKQYGFSTNIWNSVIQSRDEYGGAKIGRKDVPERRPVQGLVARATGAH